MTNFWDRYKSRVYANCTSTAVQQNSIQYSKNQLFAALAVYLIPLSLIALVPGVYMVLKLGIMGMLAADFITIGTLLGVILIPGISVFARKVLFNAALYFISLVMLHYLGSSGPGMLYLLTVTIFVVLTLHQFYGYVVLALNTVSCLFFALAIQYEFASTILLAEFQLDTWIAVSSNLIFLSGAAVFLIPHLFNSLQSSFKEQALLKEKLEESLDELRFSEQKFKALVQDGSDLIAVLDEEANYKYVAPTSESVLGITAEEFIGTNALDYIHPNDQQRIASVLSHLPDEERVEVPPFRFRDNKDNWRWIESTITNMLKKPAVEGFVANSRDVTEQIEQEKKLRERVKEKDCLYKIIALREDQLSIDELLSEAVLLFPAGWQYPKITEARIEYDDNVYSTDRFKLTDQMLTTRTADDTVGKLEITISLRESDEEIAFIEEEEQLLEIIAKHLVQKIEYILGEQKVKKAQQLMDKMSRLAKIGYWELDLENETVVMSKMTKEIHNVDPEFTPSLENALTFYPEGEHRDRIQEAVDKAINHGIGYDIEVLFRTAKGREIWVRAIGEPLFKNGECIRLTGSFQNIDNRKRAQIESDRSRKLLRGITNHTNAAIWVRNKEGRHIFINEEWKRIFGLKEQEVIGKTLYDLLDPKTADEFNAHDLRVIRSNKSEKFEENIDTPNGKRYFLTNMFPMSDIPGLKKAAGGIATDITEQKELEQKLRLHSRLLEEVGEAVVATDPEGKIIYWNRAAEQIYGWSSEEALGENIIDITPSLESKALASEIWDLLQRGENWSGEIEVQRKDGSTFPAVVTDSPVFDEQGELMAVIGVSADITERKRTEEKIRKNLKEKETLLAEIHHRVKNNLAIITSMMELQVMESDKSELQDTLREAQQRIQTISTIHELLYGSKSLSHLNFGKNITQLVHSLEEMYDSNKQIAVTLEVDPVSININQAIPCALLVNEVVTNAYKHAFTNQEKGTIKIKLQEKNENVILEVRDNGKGLPDKFMKENVSSIGMTLIKLLKQQLEGEMEFSSANGTRFILRFKKTNVKGIGSSLTE